MKKEFSSNIGDMDVDTYQPSEKLVSAVIVAILAPLPFLIGKGVKWMPGKEKVISFALATVVPATLRAMASTKNPGERIVLTKRGTLTEEAKESLVKRIAKWLIPSEVTDITDALYEDITELAYHGYAESAWHLEIDDEGTAIRVTAKSLIRESADTVFDIWVNSVEAIKKIRDKFPK